MRELPTGTATLLFTDIAGSTRLLQQLGERYSSLLETCRLLLRAEFQKNYGYEVDTQGDAFFIAFARALFNQAWPDDVRVSVRDLGDYRLKDLGRPVRLYQLVIEGLASDFPSLKTLDNHPHNLPVQPTPFIGREKEVAALKQQLLRESVRLLTLTGPGGVGKTRLSLQVAAELSERFSDGTWFVSLAPISDPDLLALSQYEAMALFIERAQAVVADFQVTNINAPAVAEICVRLDGLPLAIELAAARIKVLPPQALLARLGQRLAVLTGGARDAPARQQTLHNTIDWSYQLLKAAEQRLFRWLSIFVGGCTMEAIEEEGGPRFMMLETIREFGLVALVESGEMEVTHKAHAEYYLRLAEEAEPGLTGAQQAVWLDRLERELDNLREALVWCLERGGMGQNRETALRLAGSLQRFWEVRGHWSEGRTFLEWALAGSKGVAGPVRVRMLKVAAHMACVQSDIDRAEVLSEECLARCRELGDTAGIALSLRLGRGADDDTRASVRRCKTIGSVQLNLRRASSDNCYEVDI